MKLITVNNIETVYDKYALAVKGVSMEVEDGTIAVSYTHLTLPTILRV